MFRKSDTSSQLDLFTNPSTILPPRAHKKYLDSNAWHNRFYSLVTSKIDEESFSVLFKTGNMGAPNVSIRVLIAMMILKEGFGCSDESLFEKCEFDLLSRRALGLENLNDVSPSLDTYYLLRRRICQYEQEHKVNLLEACFQQVTGEQVKMFKIQGDTVRMDSKQIGSNIAWYSRYVLIHKTLKQYIESHGVSRLNPKLIRQIADLMQEDAQKIAYRSDSGIIQNRLNALGNLVYRIIVRIKADNSLILCRVFHEQFTVEKGIITPRENKDISAKSVQTPYDTDAEYRNKGGKKNKGYTTNITETTDEEGKPSLITDVQVKGSTAADNSFVQDSIENTQKVTGKNVRKLITDGAYQSKDNREYLENNDIEYIATGIQGKEPRFDPIEEDGEITAFLDKNTGKVIPATKTKEGKLRIKIEGKLPYRYFTDQQMEALKQRKKLTQIPQEERNKRNNVEASIFQYCFHTRNNKTRYRGLLKHKLYSYARCMWVNLMRIVIFEVKIA